MVCKRSIKAVEEIVRDFLPSKEPEGMQLFLLSFDSARPDPCFISSSPAVPGANPFAAFGASPMGAPPLMQSEKPPRAACQRAPKPAVPAPDLGPQLDLD